MKILVTGHLGFIGPVMIRLLKQDGHQVVGLDCGYFRECHDGPVIAPDVEIVRDIREVEIGDLDGVECIIHLAGLSNDPMGQLDPTLTEDINFKASVRLARLAKQAKVSRFIFASSCSLYGASGDPSVPLDETAPLNPVSAYAISKVRTEEELSKMADESFCPVYMRNATAYGVSSRVRFDLVLNNLMGWARVTGKIRVMSDGTPWRPLVHIEDIALAALCAAKAPREAVFNEPFNVGRNDANYQVRDIAEVVARKVPGAELLITGETGGDLRSYRVDFTKALTKLPGFVPSWTLERGADELYDWFDNHDEAVRGFQSRWYVRLQQLNHLIETRQLDERLSWCKATVDA